MITVARIPRLTRATIVERRGSVVCVSSASSSVDEIETIGGGGTTQPESFSLETDAVADVGHQTLSL